MSTWKQRKTLCWVMAQHFFLAMASIVLTMGWQNAKKNTAKLFPFNMADVNYVAHFDTKIQSLKDYLGAFQSNKELVSPFVAAHKITYGDDKEPRLKTQSFFAFELKSLAQNMQVSQQNGLSYVEKVDLEKWSTPEIPRIFL